MKDALDETLILSDKHVFSLTTFTVDNESRLQSNPRPRDGSYP